MDFNTAFARVVGIEGDFSNAKNDRGGATRFGITEAVAREEGYAGPMNALPLDFAKSVYRRKYWDKLRLDDVALVSGDVAYKLFDAGVNMGPAVSGTFLQRTLNVLNRQGVDYADVLVDGAVGDKTLRALRGLWAKRPTAETVVMRALNCLQGARYIEIAERDPRQEDFEFGWLSNRIGMA